MKVLILCLAVASTCALNLRGSKIINDSPVVPFFEPEARITDGLTAKDNQFPYNAGLMLLKNSTNSRWCSGALISRNWVLTTASCLEGVREIYVYLGSNERRGGEMFVTGKFIIHPEFDGYNNDIALVNVQKVTLWAKTNIVPLPAISETYSNYVHELAIVSGWGQKVYTPYFSKKLLYAILPIVDNSVCSKAYGSSHIKPSVICLASYNQVSPCSGDTGAPLVLAKTGILVGLFSYGSSDGCRKGAPVVFTRVDSYRTWIKNITEV